jgi:hypothetical protein
MSDEVELSVQEIENYTENIITSSRLMRTPRNSTSDFAARNIRYEQSEAEEAADDTRKQPINIPGAMGEREPGPVASPRANSVMSLSYEQAVADNERNNNNNDQITSTTNHVSFNVSIENNQHYQDDESSELAAATGEPASSSSLPSHPNSNISNNHNGNYRPMSSRNSNRSYRNHTPDSQSSAQRAAVHNYQLIESTSPLYLTQVTLSLNLPKSHRTVSNSSFVPVWKYNTIRTKTERGSDNDRRTTATTPTGNGRHNETSTTK